PLGFLFFFFNDTATTEIYTLSLHDALPICDRGLPLPVAGPGLALLQEISERSEEHTSELQSLTNLVCRLLLEKKTCRSEEHTSELQSLTNLVCRLLLEKNKRISVRFSAGGEGASPLAASGARRKTSSGSRAQSSRLSFF